MTEEEKKAADQQKEAFDKAQSELKALSVDKLIEIINDTRTEAKERRLKNKELEERLTAIEKQKQDEEQNKKLAEGKKDEVITDLTGKLKQAEEKAKKYDEYDLAKRTKLKVLFGEKWMPSFEKPEVVPLLELEDLASKITNDTSLLDSDNGVNKKKLPGKLEGLQKDLELAVKNRDLKAQIQIRGMIDEERKKK